jgi:antitoxin component YwqK of YwqJK toxin-antitoxin module
MYDETGRLMYKGGIRNFLPYGSGKMYRNDASGHPVITEEGDYEGSMVNGILFNMDGTVAATGQYDPETQKHISTARTAMYRGKICNIFCDSIRRGQYGAVYNGNLRVREREEDNPNARLLLEMYYVDGVPNGNVKAWDYDNGVYHFLQMRDGVPRTDGLNAGIIDRISDNAPVATEVRYADGAAGSGEFTDRIVYGLFHFGVQFLAISGPPQGAGIALYKQAYARGEGQVFDPNGPPVISGGTGGNTGDGQDNAMVGVDPQYTRADVMMALRNCAVAMQHMKTMEDELNDAARFMTTTNYDRGRRQFEAKQLEVVSAYDRLLERYDGRIPSRDYLLIQARRNRIKALRV